jgi:hypothetical protein
MQAFSMAAGGLARIKFRGTSCVTTYDMWSNDAQAYGLDPEKEGGGGVDPGKERALGQMYGYLQRV